MDTILTALRVALASYREEVKTLAAEEENVAAYTHTLQKRRLRLEREIEELEAKLTEEQEGG